MPAPRRDHGARAGDGPAVHARDLQRDRRAPRLPTRDLSALTLAVGAEPLYAAIPDRPGGPKPTATASPRRSRCARGPSRRRRAASSAPSTAARCRLDLKIVDGETGEELPTGQLGEIAVKGVTFMLGYYKGYAEEYLDRNGYFRTGDSGHLDEDGGLHWGGRLTAMIKTGGANVSPVEIESKLSLWGRAEGGHRRARAPSAARRGRGGLRRVPRRRPVSSEEILGHLKSVLASYKVPKRVVFVDERELSYTATEKVKLADARRVAAAHRRGRPRVGRLPAAHADLLAEPAGTCRSGPGRRSVPHDAIASDEDGYIVVSTDGHVGRRSRSSCALLRGRAPRGLRPVRRGDGGARLLSWRSSETRDGDENWTMGAKPKARASRRRRSRGVRQGRRVPEPRPARPPVPPAQLRGEPRARPAGQTPAWPTWTAPAWPHASSSTAA